MSKLKTANCEKCGNAIKRHDANRVERRIQARISRGYRTISLHLACSQK